MRWFAAEESATDPHGEADGYSTVPARTACDFWGRLRPRTHTLSAILGDLLALTVLVGALLLPDRLTRTDLGSFAAVPVELVLGGALLLVLPARSRRPVASVLGIALGALTVLKIIDIGFYGALARPFDLVLDWTLLPGAWQLLHSSLGSTVAVLVVAAAGLLVLAVLAGTTWACRRLARLLDGHSAAAVPVLAALAALWITCAATGVRAVPPYAVASASSTTKIIGEVAAVREGLVDQDRFAAELAQDRFRDVPADTLLAGLQGKQVLVIFVESYGRVALSDPDIAPAVTAVLDDGTRRLGSAGWQSRSGYLTSPTAGGGSWLAHATLLSGLWIDTQQRYRNLVASDRLTLTRAFGGSGWRTIGVMPGNTSAWPDGDVYGYDEIHDSRSLGYAGPAYGWARVPDQYTLAEAERLMTEGARPSSDDGGRAAGLQPRAVDAGPGPGRPGDSGRRLDPRPRRRLGRAARGDPDPRPGPGSGRLPPIGRVQPDQRGPAARANPR